MSFLHSRCQVHMNILIHILSIPRSFAPNTSSLFYKYSTISAIFCKPTQSTIHSVILPSIPIFQKKPAFQPPSIHLKPQPHSTLRSLSNFLCSRSVLLTCKVYTCIIHRLTSISYAIIQAFQEPSQSSDFSQSPSCQTL